MKKNKKKLKGMTLIEIIIALAVFAMLGVLLVTASNVINAHIRATNNLNRKVTVQGPIAEAKNTADAIADGTIEISVTPAGVSKIDLEGQVYVAPTENVPVNAINGDLNLKFVYEISTLPAATATTAPATTDPAATTTS